MSTNRIYIPTSWKEASRLSSKFYYTGKQCKNGHLSFRRTGSRLCLKCEKEYGKAWKAANPDKVKDQKRRHSKKKSAHITNRVKKWRENNKDRYRKHSREYMSKRREDPSFKSLCICRDLIRRTIKSKSNRTEKLIGYSSEDLRLHIESLFLEGMSWDNYGDWHIDHIYPIDKFIKQGITDPSIINELNNLHPMWAEDNLSKGNMLFEEWSSLNPEKSNKYINRN